MRVCLFFSIILMSGFVLAGEPQRCQEEMIANAYSTWQKANVEILKARAQLIQAWSAAYKNMIDSQKVKQEIYSLYLDNQTKKCETYFAKKEKREQYKSQHKKIRLDTEAYIRVSNAQKPKALSQYYYNPDTKKINWPSILEREEFVELRSEAESLLMINDNNEIYNIVDKMDGELRKIVKKVQPMCYTEGKQFLKSLEYEIRNPQGINAIVRN